MCIDTNIYIYILNSYICMSPWSKTSTKRRLATSFDHDIFVFPYALAPSMNLSSFAKFVCLHNKSKASPPKKHLSQKNPESPHPDPKKNQPGSNIYIYIFIHNKVTYIYLYIYKTNNEYIYIYHFHPTSVVFGWFVWVIKHGVSMCQSEIQGFNWLQDPLRA